MAYVEVWKSGRLITRRRVDEQKAQKGCRVRLGSAGEVRVAIGQSETLGKLEVRMFAGEPPPAWQEGKETASIPPQDDQSLPPFSVEAPGHRAEQMDRYPDIEGYKIIEPLGEGGMGIVWRAEQLSTRRQVALKLMVSHRIESPKAQARFQREVELTARLDHPNIARIYDSGLHRGMYYYAMELIDGVPLDQYVKNKSLSRTQILALMQKVCQTVLYAHLRAVIHRDLKPSNIIVSPDGQPHVLDFGLAKALLEEEEVLTISVEGQIAGTPAYMSPEQAAGHHSQTDTRTDVFSLGVILYELLTGQSPHDLSGSMFDVLHEITEGRIRRPREIDKSIDSELEALLLKALAQNPEDRYASAGALAKDITNYLDEEPLDAKVPTILYYLRKKALKYRVQVAIGLAVSFVLLGIILLSYTKIVTERAVREAQDVELELKSKKLTWAELELKALGSNQEEAQAALRILRDEYLATQKNVVELQQKLDQRVAPVPTKRINLIQGEPLSPTVLVRQPALPQGVQSWTLETYGHRGRITKLAYSPNGRWLASSSSDGTLRLWDSDSGQLTKILVDPDGSIVDLAWSADSKNLIGIGSLGSKRWVWDPELGKVQLASDTPTIEKLRQDTHSVSWSSEGDMPVRTIDEIINLWEIDLPDGGRSFQRTATAFALSPDRSTLAFGDGDGSIQVLYLESGRLRSVCTPSWCGPVYSVAFSPDGDVLATCSGAGTVCLWDAHRWQPLRKFQAGVVTGGSSSGTSVFAWSPDGTAVAVRAGQQNVLAIMDSQSGKVLHTLKGNVEPIICVAWAPDSRLLATGTLGGTTLLWDMESESPKMLPELAGSSGSVKTITWSSDSRRLITAGEDGIIRLWDPNEGTLSGSLRDHRGPVTCLAVSPDGQILASASRDQTVRLWDVQRGRMLRILRDAPSGAQAEQVAFTAIAWSPDGTALASGDIAGNIQIWDPDSGKLLHSFKASCGRVTSLSWSPDGQLLVCGGSDGTARVWDVKNTYKEYLVLLPLWSSVGPGIAINPEGDYRGPPGIADHLVYVIQTKVGQTILTQQVFANLHRWVNEPWQVGLQTPGSEIMQRIYVKADAEGPYDGISWDTAFNDLQDALSVAQPGSEIWVAAGIYNPDRGTDVREASFQLKNGVSLYGGFSGTETRRYQRKPSRNETILSGDLKDNDEPDFANNDENSYHVINGNKNNETALIDGFIITAGNANGPPQTDHLGYHRGGGVHINRGSPTLINCIIRYNSSKYTGGGMYCFGGNSLFLTDCKFTNNIAKGGGGLYICGGGKATLTRCVFSSNSSGTGGAICKDGGQLKLIDCMISNNTAKDYGGGIESYSGRTTVILSQFFGNISKNAGGAIYNAYKSELMLTNCSFINNSTGIQGGAIDNRASTGMLTNCIFIGNSATKRGGAISNCDTGHLDLVNCTLAGNRSNRAGGVCNNPKDPSPTSTSTLSNCILWGNTDGDSVEAAQIQGGTIVVNNCCIQGWTGNLGGIGNFWNNPLFVDADGADNEIGTEDDDLRLSPSSPCINVGDNAALPADTYDLDSDGDLNEPIPLDLESKPRILNGTVDIGAYESG